MNSNSQPKAAVNRRSFHHEEHEETSLRGLRVLRVLRGESPPRLMKSVEIQQFNAVEDRQPELPANRNRNRNPLSPISTTSRFMGPVDIGRFIALGDHEPETFNAQRPTLNAQLNQPSSWSARMPSSVCLSPAAYSQREPPHSKGLATSPVALEHAKSRVAGECGASAPLCAGSDRRLSSRRRKATEQAVRTEPRNTLTTRIETPTNQTKERTTQ